jgi:PQQ-like domain
MGAPWPVLCQPLNLKLIPAVPFSRQRREGNMRLTSRLVMLGGLAALTALAAGSSLAGASAAPAAVPSQWPQFGQSPRHLNTNPAEKAFSTGNVGGLRTLFTADFGSNTATEGGPAVANGVLYQAGFDGNLNAYPASGCGQRSCQPLWRGTAAGDFTSTPAVAGGLVFIASADHFLYAFPAAGCGAAICAPRWKAHLRAAVVDSSVAVAGGVAYVGDFSGHLYAFTAAGCGAAVCQPLWAGHGLSTELIGAPAVANGLVYVTTFHNTPNLFNGRLLVFPAAGCGQAFCTPSWTAGIGGPAGSTAAPAVTATTVYTTSGTLFGNGANTRFHLMAFPATGCGANTCKPLRSYDTGDGGAEGAPAVSGNMLFATTQGTPDPNTIGVVAAYPAAGCGKPRCEPLWTGVNFESGFASRRRWSTAWCSSARAPRPASRPTRDCMPSRPPAVVRRSACPSRSCSSAATRTISVRRWRWPRARCSWPLTTTSAGARLCTRWGFPADPCCALPGTGRRWPVAAGYRAI